MARVYAVGVIGKQPITGLLNFMGTNMTNSHQLFIPELRDEIINIFINDPYNTEGHYQANRVHAPDGTKGWPDHKNIDLIKLRDKYGYQKFDTTFNTLINANIIIKEIINEYEVYSLSKEFILKNLIPEVFPDDQHNQDELQDNHL